MEGSVKRLELLANFWQIALSRDIPRNVKSENSGPPGRTFIEWWAWVDLNHRPRPYQGSVVRFYNSLERRRPRAENKAVTDAAFIRFRGPQALTDSLERRRPRAENKAVTDAAFIRFRGPQALTDRVENHCARAGLGL